MHYKYNSSRVSEILRDDLSALKDLCEVEDLLAKIKEIDKNISFFKDQKKSRTQILNDEISSLEESKEKLKLVIKMTLDLHDEDSLSFPQIGIVKKKSGMSNWVVKNEDVLIEKLQATLNEEQLNKAIVFKPKISKKYLDTLLDEWKNGGSWPDGISDLVELEVSPDSIAISLEKGFKPVPQDDTDNASEQSSNEYFFEEKNELNLEKSLDHVFGEITEEDL